MRGAKIFTSKKEIKMTNTKQKPKLPKFFLVFRIIAPILFVIGVILIIVSCTALVEYDDFFGLEPSLGCLFPGVICIFFSIPFTIIAYMPNIQRSMIKTSKYIQESNRDDLTDIMSIGFGIGIDATSTAINENEDDLRNIADKSADIMSGPMTTMSRSIARGIKEGARDTKFCKHCGSEIDRDSKFCSECGGQQ